jgi:hypothetical protein
LDHDDAKQHRDGELAVLVRSHAARLLPAAVRAAVLSLLLVAPAWAQEPDRDGDGIADGSDRCPDDAGLPPDGCPPQDTDGDGVVDRADRCPDAAGPVGNAGCPDTDGDGDGVVDRIDRCPEVSGHPAFEGCPVPDADADGVPDPDDRCADEAEVWNGNRDGDGCPDHGAAVVTVTAGGVARVIGAGFRAGDRQLDPAGARAVAVAADLVRRMRATTLTLEVVADHGLSYGDSIQRARHRAAAVRAALAAALGWPVERIEARALGPDGDPRVVLRYR